MKKITIGFFAGLCAAYVGLAAAQFSTNAVPAVTYARKVVDFSVNAGDRIVLVVNPQTLTVGTGTSLLDITLGAKGFSGSATFNGTLQ